jgi:hypothetical protein
LYRLIKPLRTVVPDLFLVHCTPVNIWQHL